jgi:hypothetical protein
MNRPFFIFMHYFLVDYVREKGNGFSPAPPREIGFLSLADPGFQCLNRKRWGLFRCRQMGCQTARSLKERLAGSLLYFYREE